MHLWWVAFCSRQPCRTPFPWLASSISEIDTRGETPDTGAQQLTLSEKMSENDGRKLRESPIPMEDHLVSIAMTVDWK